MKAYLKIIFPFSNILWENKGQRKNTPGRRNSASVQQTVLQRHHVATRRRSATIQCRVHQYVKPPTQDAEQIHRSQSIACQNQDNSHLKADLRPGPYLSIVLKHLIALHVVALEHEDGSVETRDVQTQVVRSYFFIGSVREHLENSERNKKRGCDYSSSRIRGTEMTEVLIIVDLVSTHAVTVEKANFLVLFPPHVVHTLVGLHISDLGRGKGGGGNISDDETR